MNKTDILETVSFERMIKQKNELEGFGKEVGVKIVDISEGYAKCEIEIDERHLNPGKSVHGGCIYTLADIVGGVAGWSRVTNEYYNMGSKIKL